MSFQRRMAGWPWPAVLVFQLVLGGAAMLVVGWVYDRPDLPDLWPVLGVVLLVLIPVTTAVFEVRRRRLRAEGRQEAMLDAADAFRDGRVPADPAARAELLRMVSTQRASLPFLRWGGPLIFGSQVVVQAATAFEHPRSWVAAALFAVLAVAYWVSYRRTRDRLARIAPALA